MTLYKPFGVLLLTIGLLLGCSSSTELEWNQEEHYRWAEVTIGFWGDTGFELMEPSQTNIEFENQMTDEMVAENRHYLNGSGVAAGDIDNDGLVDLYFAGLASSNRLYKNVDGMKFEDITDQTGLALDDYYSTGAVFADINGDRHLDLLITTIYKEILLFMNDGKGNFSRNRESGLGSADGSTTMTLADIDGDSDLDLYVAKYKEKSVKDIYTTKELEWNNILNEPYSEQQQTGPFTLTPPFDKHYQLFMTEDNRLAGVAETGEVDELYLNRGGNFEKITDTKNVFLDEEGNPYGLQPDWGLTAKFQDLNGDGLPDLYVCNDFFTKDKVWINQGNGIFKAIKWSAIRNLSFACMGVDFSDINRDEELDIFTAEMLSPEHEQRLRQMGSDDPQPNRSELMESRPTYNRNSMYLRREDDTYAEIAYLSGVEASGWSWDATFMDINLDGYQDLLINNGYLYQILDMDAQMEMIQQGRNMDEHFVEFMRKAPPLNLQNKILMNNGDLTFQDRSSEWGFTDPDISHGMAVADLNNDGALDLIQNRMNKKAAIYRNMSQASRITVRLTGQPPNTYGIGAKIRLEGGPVTQEQEINGGGDYLSGSEPVAMFAAAKGNANHTIKVTWPDGSQSQIDNVRANRIYEIDQSGAESFDAITENEPQKMTGQSAFKDVSERIGHLHHEDPFNDFELQPLLPIRLSQFGPGVAWIDLDRDGDDDLIISSGKGGTMGAFENVGDGTFRPLNSGPFDATAPGDQTAIIGWGTEQGTHLLLGSANYEQGTPRVPAAFIYHFKNIETYESETLSNYSTTGHLAASDYDGDGDLDLFLGGRFVPAHYPRNASSRLFTNEQGTFVVDQVNSRKLSEIGQVTGAVFMDFDRDGDQDLLISREWDSIILMENENGTFNDISQDVGLASYRGWWNGISTGDFNNDGLPDIVATNWGLNSPYQLEEDNTLRMYYEDFNRDQRVDIIEAYTDENDKYVPRRRLYHFGSIPTIANKMRSYGQFADATLEGIFGNQLSQIPYKEINTLRHMLFINTGATGFEARPLPIESQFTAAFYAGVADYDNDGNEDLFLSQNFFSVPSQVPRLDAGRGLWLKGDGEGNLTVVPGSRSGIKIYGDQRGAAFSDFNRDGKVDLSVSQNGAQTKLFLNQVEKTGYRITLIGPPENLDGVGSGIRLQYSNGGKGPVRVVENGSGYWSQNSYTQIMGAEADVKSIEVTWFDGSQQSVTVQDGEMNYIISYNPDE